jgi:hypothetical protein
MACLAGALFVGRAHAQDPTQDTGGGPARNFGRAGQLAFLSDNTVDIRHSTNDVTTISLAPAADYFIIDNLSIGGFIGFNYTKAGNADGTRFAIGPRVGYNLALSNMLSVWPKLGLAYAHSSAGYSVDNSTISQSNNALALNMYVPFMIHPVTHLFLGLGPYLDTDLSGDDRVTAFGVKLTVGGWLSI